MQDGTLATSPLRASALLSLPEFELIEHVQICRRPELIRIYRFGLVCRCLWFPGHGYGLRACTCMACGTTRRPVSYCRAAPEDESRPLPASDFVPCPHDEVLPAPVCAVLLARLWPRLYAEPPLDAPSDAASQGERLQLLIDRANRNKRLGHPRDAQQSGIDGLADAFGVKVNRKRNGGICEIGIVKVKPS